MQWLMLQQERPDDFVIATGQQYSVRQFVDFVAKGLDLTIEWTGQGIEERGIDSNTGDRIIAIDPRYFRPTEVETLLGDATKAKDLLGWEPEISFDELVNEMVQEDLKIAQRDHLVHKAGYKAFSYNE